MFRMIQLCDKFLGKIIEIFEVFAFSLMTCLVAAQVFVRFFTDGSLTWSEELSRYTMVYMIFFGMILLCRDKGHVCIPNLVEALPTLPRKIVSLISNLIQLAFFVTMVHGSVKMFPIAAMRMSAVLKIPMHWVYMCIPVTGVLMAVYILRDTICLLHPSIGGDKPAEMMQNEDSSERGDENE